MKGSFIIKNSKSLPHDVRLLSCSRLILFLKMVILLLQILQDFLAYQYRNLLI